MKHQASHTVRCAALSMIAMLSGAGAESLAGQAMPDHAVFAESGMMALVALPATVRDTGYTPDSTPPRRVVMTGPIAVPLLRANARDSRPQIEVLVNGKGPYRFDVETGAREIGVSRALATTLGLRRIGGPDNYREYHVDSIGVGSATFHDMPVAELPAGVDGVDGVLGLPFYQNVLLTIDYPAERVHFSLDTLPAANGRDILQLSRVSAFWGLPITIAGRRFDAVLDTQNSGALDIPPGVADQLSFDGGLQTVGRARGAFGTVDIKGGRLTGDVAIGQYTFPTPFLAVVQLPPDFPNHPNVGSRLLENFVVSLDQRHRRLRLARDGSSVVSLPEPKPRAAPVGGAAPGGDIKGAAGAERSRP